MTWTQIYNPLGNIFVSALVAALPVIVLLGLLAFLHVRAHIAALAGLAAALLIAIAVYGMPFQLAFASAANGAMFGLFPIGWIVLAAVFVYDITVKTGQFEIVKQSIAGLSDDRRIQALLIAFSFGAFIEGAAGFGTPVAISAAMLIGLGFKPLTAAVVALIGNTAPVAFGSLGTPIIALAEVTKLPILELSAMAGRQLPFFSVIVPFWLIWAMCGWKAMKEVWLPCLVSGVSFAIFQFLISNFHGPWLVDIIAALVSIFSLIVLLRFWKPKTIWRFEHETEAINNEMPEKSAIIRAWMPWAILTVFVFAWGVPQIKGFLNDLTTIKFAVPYLDKMIQRAPPVVQAVTTENAVFSFNWLTATGTALLLTGIISGLILGLSPKNLLEIFWGTFKRVQISLLTIAAMLALAYASRFGGLDATMGLAFASTGFLFPFFSAMLGWLGVALTGSDTSSNVLFGNLQQITAEQVGISPVLAAASNSSGGVMGKMIDAQSIVVASVATGQQGGEGEILRAVFWHSVVLASLVGVLVMLQAYVFPWMTP
jgi:lactate permease